MATKDALLKLLGAHPGSYLSGQELADTLGISRAAVCKAVKSLKDQGLSIDAVTNRGYRLNQSGDLLTEASLTALLKKDTFSLILSPSLPSTNSKLRELAQAGAPEGTVVLARQQTAGRGRMGRSFFSPEDTGLYLSLLLRPESLTPSQSLQLTTAAAAAMCQTIEAETGLSPTIKWVNDLYLEGRKICGILTEAALSMETGTLSYAVLGLGLNLYPPKEGFPPELSAIAGSLCRDPSENLRVRLAAGFLNRFWDCYQRKDFAAAARYYRSRCPLEGKTVLVGADRQPARVVKITDTCRLQLQYPDGREETLSYGEVSIVNPNKI